jgi:hypothetical protein
MNFRFRISLLLKVATLLFLPGAVFAQLNQGGLPCSFSQSIAPDTVTRFFISSPSMDALALEDRESPLPYRFAVNLAVDLAPANTGYWVTAGDGTRVWRLNIKSAGALALMLYFDRFNLPPGGKLFVYNPRRTQLLGAFTSLNNNSLSTFAISMIFGDELTIEYNTMDELLPPDFHISEVGHAYRGVSVYAPDKSGFGNAGRCEVNINCQEGSAWQKEKKSVTRIMVKRGTASVWCTGSLINNVKNDGTPYILTADHCGKLSTAIDLSQWIFYFNYESTGCPNPLNEPSSNSMTGATLVAHGGDGGNTGSDFFLVLLDSKIPASFKAYYAGWSREANDPSPSGTGIHHPQGDIKKISTYATPLQPAYWSGNPHLAFWSVNWSGTVNGNGVTEPGSSGSPLFDNQGRLVGTLTGGDSSCDSSAMNSPDFYGMFSYHWDQNGSDSASALKYWLDPDNTNIMALNGWALSAEQHGEDDLAATFPNPVTDVLNVHLSLNHNKNFLMSVVDLLGNQRIKCDWNPRSHQDKQIDVSRLPAGVYFLILTDGDKRMVQKIIKY